MTSKHPKPGGAPKNAQSNDHHGANGEQRVKGDVRVTGQIETHLPPNLIKEKAAAETKKESRERKKFIVEVATMFLVAIYAGLTVWQAIESRRAAIASEKASDTAKEQLDLTKRPWVSSVASIGSPIWFDENGANLRLNFRLRNSGLTPATHAFVEAQFIPTVGGDKAARDEIKKNTCVAAQKGTDSSEVTIFPNSEVNEVRKIALDPYRIKLLAADGRLYMDVSICVAYISGIEPNQSFFSGGQIYNLSEITPSGERVPFIVGTDISPDKLSFHAQGEDSTLVIGNYTLSPGDTDIIFQKDAATGAASWSQQQNYGK